VIAVRRTTGGSVLVALVALLLVSGSPAWADEIGDLLQRTDGAVYSGRQMVSTNWDGVSAVDVVDVEHARGVTVVDDGSHRSMVARGRVRVSGRAVAFVGWDDRTGPSPGRYRLVHGGTARHLGRFGDVVGIMEGDLLRVRMVVDHTTGAPLLTQVFDGSGRVFRYASMVEFRPYTTDASVTDDGGDYEVMPMATTTDLPGDAGGYERVDVYEGPDDVQQGFYTDGLFSFSLFAIDGVQDIHEMAGGGSSREFAGFPYDVVVAPAEMWVLWTTPDRTFVLVGDLPPDHVDDVLADLPRPARRGLLSRLWHGLFG